MTNKSPQRLIFLTIFIDLLGFGMIIPILPAISAHYLSPQMSGLGAGILMASFSLLQMIFSPVWGRLSDRHGRRPILLLSLFGSTASYLIFAFADSYPLLLLSRLLAGICGANITAAQAYISDITSEKDRTAGMGLVGMAFGLGFTFGPVLGGGATHLWHALVPSAMTHTGTGLAASAICATNLVWAIFSLPESLPVKRRGKVHFQRFASARETWTNLTKPGLGPLIFLFFLVTFAFANLEVIFSLYAHQVMRLETEQIFGLFVFIGLVMAFIQGFLVRRVVKFIPEPVLMIAGVALLTLGLGLLPIKPWVPYVLMAMTIMSTGQGICTPSILSLISRSASEQAQGNVFGTSQSAASLARIVGPIFGGIIFDTVGPRWPFWAASAIMAFAIAWAMFTRRQLIAHRSGLASRV